MWSPTDALLGLVVVLAAMLIGGGAYEFTVLDPVWPRHPALIQPQHGGVSRKRFWIAAHASFEVALIVALVATWAQPAIRIALLVALGSHVLMRLWSLVDFIPKAVAFEQADPAAVDRAAAVRWTRRSWLRIPLDAVTCVAALIALTATG